MEISVLSLITDFLSSRRCSMMHRFEPLEKKKKEKKNKIRCLVTRTSPYMREVCTFLRLDYYPPLREAVFRERESSSFFLLTDVPRGRERPMET